MPDHAPLRFRFDEDKLVQAVAYLSHKGVRDLTRLKAVKLLFFADKAHLLRYGRPIVGDHYACLPLGPVPITSLDYLRDAEDADSVGLPPRRAFKAALRAGKSTGQRYPRLAARPGVLFDALSQSDREVLDEVVAQYGRHSARKLVDLSHDERCWKAANVSRAPSGRTELPYELFFKGAGAKARDMLSLAQAEQEDRDLADAIAR